MYEEKNFLERENLIQQPVRKPYLSKRKINILIGVNRETVKKLSKEPSPLHPESIFS